MSLEATYAEALYEAAAENGALDAVTTEVREFAEAVAASDDLRRLLADPNIDTPAKKRVVLGLTEGASPFFGNFLQLLIDRGRIEAFPAIAEAFDDRVDRAENRLEVEAVTAIPLPADLRERIVDQIRAKTGADVELTETVDPDIIGGLVLRVGASVVDGSVRHRLEGLRATLRSAPVDAVAVES
ncbi:ATP synthase F1 subunit delta [Miltoncostaea marina]|uniref:ATP synthase F1 subunit delta n=1 Tax=Miltoncostaea marina TaxID=2843215 RepID=UPI001C3E32DE|nr:ATP synthase F1 subunit delta [Miltoncostaea marina]